MKKKIRIIRRKLGREGAYGRAFENGKIEIDPRLESGKHLEILIHEWLHVRFPRLSEAGVLGLSRDLKRVLWKERFRRVEK